MDIRQNDLRYAIGVKENNDRVSLAANIQTQESLSRDEMVELETVGLTTDKQATATIAETIVIQGGGGDHEYYRGAYEAIPMITSQTFATREKIMARDFFVETIPTTETLNDAGGFTFKIG